MKGFALAHRAPAWPGETFAFFEDEATFDTLCRLDDKSSAGPMKGLPNMLQVAGNRLFGNAHQPGDITGREHPLLQFGHDEVAHRIIRLDGRTGPFISFIVLPSHEINILLSHISVIVHSRPREDRNILFIRK